MFCASVYNLVRFLPDHLKTITWLQTSLWLTGASTICFPVWPTLLHSVRRANTDLFCNNFIITFVNGIFLSTTIIW